MLCIICIWHAIVSVFDQESLNASFSGYVYMTLEQYNSQKTSTSDSLSILKESNDTVVKNVLTIGQRSDRVALVVFLAIYVTFHVAFILWMYLTVFKLLKLKFIN